jgi:hypothetical protein
MQKSVGGSRNQQQQQGCSSTPACSRRVSDWVNLFQSSEKCPSLDNAEIGQYSCSKLLKELEAAESDSDPEDLMVTEDDVELVRIPEDWLEMVNLTKGCQGSRWICIPYLKCLVSTKKCRMRLRSVQRATRIWVEVRGNGVQS